MISKDKREALETNKVEYTTNQVPSEVDSMLLDEALQDNLTKATLDFELAKRTVCYIKIFEKEFCVYLLLEVRVPMRNKLEVWFHGRLSRLEAEEKLKSVRRIGAFLIRESGSLPKTFVLSFLKSLEDVVHFRITVLCGEYFADDRKFESLIQFVEYYSSQTKICSGRYLTYPVKPAQVAEPMRRKVVAVVSFRGMKDTDELSFVKGEILTVVEEMGGNWLWALSDRSNERGLVYEGLVEDLTSESLAPSNLPYFYDNLEPQEAVAMLAKAGKGSYLVKRSDTCPQHFTLMVYTNQKVQKVSIRTLKSGLYEVAGRTFKSLHDIVDRYSHNEICDGIKLSRPMYKCLEVPDSNNSLDVELYKKLKLNRFSYNTLGGKISKSGYLYKKGKNDDKWRHLFVLLKEAEGQLFIYENNKCIKPKSVLDLCHCSYYDVHVSLFNQPGCFQIILHGINKPVVLFFYSESESEYEEWSALLKPLCSGHRQGLSSPFSCYRKSSDGPEIVRRAYHLSLKIFEARFDNTKQIIDIFATLSINDARIYRTSFYSPCSASTKSVLLQEDINFEDLNSEIHTVSVHFFGKSKRNQRQTDLGCARVDLHTNNASGCQTKDNDTISYHEWIKLKYREVECGQCRINLVYRRQVIMPVEEYGSLFEVLKSNNFDVCQMISRHLCDKEKHQLALALINIFNANHISLHFVIQQLELEVIDSDESSCLFRKTSFASILVYELLNRDALEFVRRALKKPVAKIVGCKVQLETDVQRLRSNGTDLAVCPGLNTINSDQSPFCTNMLIDLAKDVCKAIYDSSPYFPNAFLFLRLICLALLDPKRYGLVTESPSDSVQRNLLLVTRIVQKAANVREKKCCASPEDEDYDLLESISSSYLDAKLYISQFIEAVSSACPLPPDTSVKHWDIAPHFAMILSLSQKYINEIRNEPIQRVSAFLSVIEMLQNHLNRYMSDDLKMAAQTG